MKQWREEPSVINGNWTPCHAREMVVSVYSYHNGIMNGYLQYPAVAGKQKLESLSQLMVEIDRFLEARDCPQERYLPLVFLDHDAQEHQRILKIDVLFREHHTWQGKLILEEEKSEVVFRSVLELMKLIDEILEE